MDKEILAAVTGASDKLSFITNDRIDAMAASHGSLNIATLAAMDVCIKEIVKGTDISLSFKNTERIELDNVIEKLLRSFSKYNVDKANAAVISAIILYFAGTDPRAGVPAGNRKLGAMCRIATGIPRAGVANLTTPKLGNKVTAFASVLAIYDTLRKEGLTNVNGCDIPFGAIGTLYMHSVLGEDIVLPEIITKGTKAAVEGIYNAMKGVGMMMCNGMADRISSAILGSAAMLEIIHPDANVKFEDTYIPSSHLVGKIAAEIVGIPPELTMAFTGQKYDSGELIGDLGLILKDSGNFSVIAMMDICDMFAMFEEWLVWTGGPTITPIAALGGEAWVAMQILIDEDGDIEKAVSLLSTCRDHWFDPEISKIGLNIVASKALETSDGPVSRTLYLATQSTKVWALYNRAIQSQKMFQEGQSIEKIVKSFDDKRKQVVQKSAGEYCSNYFKRKIQLEVTRIEPLGRIAKKGEGIGKFWSLDPDVDVKVVIDGEEYMLEKLCEVWIPKIALGQYSTKEERIAVEAASICIQDLSYSGVLLFNVTVPTCIGVALGMGSVKELATKASDAAYITGGIPGSRLKCIRTGNITKRLMEFYQEKY